ncbi:histidine kinase [Gordonia sp. TBRC 11910]|uniref:Histidine kinase n=1 Tax=Gordonia asplenii TaxID=2725283 RepID=A0A848L2S9_9ACTN|nr:putative nucleotidyltransferase substrate binding domain-containing protein [Gordonia asplenii]NMO05039.1 histidine kinase [Gordonia asplenii]
MAKVGKTAPGISDLEARLSRHQPFDSVGRRDLAAIAEATVVETYDPGELILDAFAHHSTDVYVVLTGAVSLWHNLARLDEPPDDQIGPGGVFGYSAMLVERSIGPRAVAARASEVARIDGEAATAAFVSRSGARFLARTALDWSPSPAVVTAGAGLAQDVARAAPLVLDVSATAGQAARAIDADGRGFAAVRRADGRYGLVTDASLRHGIIVEGLPQTTSVVEVLDMSAPIATVDDSPAELLLAMLDRGARFAVVHDRDATLHSVVSLRDLSLTPVGVDVSLHERLRYAPDAESLAARSRRVPDLLGRLVEGGLSASKVIAVNSTIRDAAMRRAIELVFAGHPGLSTDMFTWLSLGSSGRREAVLSSDIDCAASFVEQTDPTTIDACRRAFAEVTAVLGRAGLISDGHGATASREAFSRTTEQWRAAAREWIAAPERNEGAIMISLLVDGRPIYGDRGLSAARTLIGDLRSHRGTLRLLLEDTLAHRAKPRPTRTLLHRRASGFDIKRQAILPLVNIARWAALNAGSAELATTDRLRAAAGSAMMPDSAARNLIDVFDTLQRLRLHYQLMQYADGVDPSDTLTMQLMSPIDRSVIGEAIREIAAAQRRMANVSSFVDSEEWIGSTTS